MTVVPTHEVTSIKLFDLCMYSELDKPWIVIGSIKSHRVPFSFVLATF